MKIIFSTSVVLLAVLASTVVFAESPTIASAASGPKLSISEQVAQEQAQTSLLMVRVTNAKLRQQIKDAEKSGSAASSDFLAGLNAPLTAPNAVKKQIDNDERVTSIQGAGSNYQAFLQISGRTTIAEVGDILSDGWRVTQITSSSVVLTNGKNIRTLRI